MGKRLLLIDADIIVYQGLSVCNFEAYFKADDGHLFAHKLVNIQQALATIQGTIDSYKKDLNAKEVILCFSDDINTNFRKAFLPSYKSNRERLINTKPIGLTKVKTLLKTQYRTFQIPFLEGDDVLGILSTDETFEGKKKKIIISEDKDMKTIPGYLYNPRHDVEENLISEEEANLFLAQQCLAGDSIDGYKGCPSLGMQTAEDLLKEKVIFAKTLHTFKSGKKKGETEVRYLKNTGVSPSYWDTIISCYTKQGLTEEEALINAKCARILRHSDYEGEMIKLWDPTKDPAFT